MVTAARFAQGMTFPQYVQYVGSPFFDVWRAAALDEWTAMLYERMRVGSLA
jgi:hypothetical protein